MTVHTLFLVGNVSPDNIFMISISPWFQRPFRFDLEPRYFPLVLERLYGTAIRLDRAVVGLPVEILTLKPGAAWSIQEHAGHLVDLEPLWLGRINDILNNHEEMRAADLANNKTDEAGHNGRRVTEIVSEFTSERGRLTDRLADLTMEDVARSALHPRLKQPMRIIDLAVFVAEHDDHHLATIRARLANQGA